MATQGGAREAASLTGPSAGKSTNIEWGIDGRGCEATQPVGDKSEISTFQGDASAAAGPARDSGERSKRFSFQPEKGQAGPLLFLAVGTLALSPVVFPSAASAQCNSSTSPAAPPAVQTNFANQIFTPQSPYVVNVPLSQNGCGGNAGSPQNDGTPGLPGQPGAQINSTNTGLTIIGAAPVPPPSPVPTIAVSFGTFGGGGGLGGQSGLPITDPTTGGQGGAGGAGGAVTVGFNGNFLPDQSTGLARTALQLQSNGGYGGDGGDTNTSDSGAKTGGAGGAGGAGGSVALTGSGNVAAVTSGVDVYSAGGLGGAGGPGDSSFDLLSTAEGGAGGNGGKGGTASVLWTGGAIQSSFSGLQAASQGGRGNAGGQAQNATGLQGGAGGVGGDGGTASATLAGGSVTINQPVSLTGLGSAISAISNGGSGGVGGLAGASFGSGGGSGGNGGNGGNASVTVLGSVNYAITGNTAAGTTYGQAVLVQSNGAAGGNGGGASGLAGGAGGGGFAGAGGSAGLTLGGASNSAVIRSTGPFAHGALVQSVGGGGGNGGAASFVFGGGSGGAGQAGGDGGTVNIAAPNGSVIVSGPSSIAQLAQSIGGGGGAGGDAGTVSLAASIAIGGNGGQGGDGGNVVVSLGPGGVYASTSTLGGGGVLAQSIGGSGGFAGSANATGAGLLSLTVGGDAGGGGQGGSARVDNGALVTTYGDHATGIQAQSIGGGGGKGGAAVTFVAGILPAAAVAIGGRGGGGGTGGTVSVDNMAQITTYGSDAHGVLVQSIGGGGGTGGASAARAVALSPDKRIPAVSIAVSIGGAGGDGNTGGNVSLTNSGLITTAGHGATGVIAQSIGAGGGNGGDSTAAAYSGTEGGSGLAISISASVGGRGGSGGTSSLVNVVNSGLVLTFGQDAYGVLAQSIGGGGGTGGGGDASASSSDAKFSFGNSTAVGGSGGSGGNSGAVTLTNTGAITTRGDGSDGVFAQSIGGGGGAAGGGTATAAGGTVSVSVGVGGSGGAGGSGNAVTIRNTGGSIITRGTDAVGIFAQSIGGGGGKGGKGGATAGGVTDLSNFQALFDTLSAGLNFGQGVTKITDNILQIGQTGENIQASYNELRDILPQPQSGDGEEGSSSDINIQVNVGAGIGGKGGAGGDGGTVIVANTGQIGTFGAQSDGVLVQSIGGGGGSGGAASSVGAASDDTPIQTSVSVGGGGGSAGSGGIVDVTNGTGGQILTQGVLAMGIVAQSIGGGGGEGSVAGTVNGSLKSLGVGVGGNGGAAGNGGGVSVTTGDGTASSTITTTGKHGIAILAQSIGGGGGLVRTMTTDQTFDPSKILNNPQGRIGDIQGFSLDLGGQNGAGGRGGSVQVTVAGPVTTSGLGAHGVVAQSIGGGGGFVAGGQFLGPVHAGGDANRTGDGGNVTVQLQSGGAIATAGDGAYGIFAQSIGGGGGMAGDPSLIGTYVRGIPTSIQRSGSGSGGTVSITATDASIRTTGSYAPAVFAQTLGGGGGMVSQGPSTTGRTLFRGSTSGNGDGGAITVSLVSSQVSAIGAGSAGILAQSTGQATGAIQISVDGNSTVTGGQPDANPAGQDRTQRDAAAIRILGGTANTITNAGRITALNGNGATGYAVLVDSARVTVTNTGTIAGEISVPTGGALVDNRPGGLISAPTTIDLGNGELRNAGTLQVGGMGTVGQTTLTGNLAQSGTGRLVIDADLAAGTADRLEVRGRALVGGTVEVRPTSIANSSVTVLTATDGLSLDPVLSASRTHLFRFDLQASGGDLQLRPAAEFEAAAGALGSNRRRVGTHLQEIWDSGARFDAGFTALGGVADGGGYARALDTLSGQTVGAIAAFRHSASHVFAGTMLDECPTFETAGLTPDRSNCAWARIFGGTASQGRTSDSLGYRADTWTLQAGAQREVSPGLFLGGSIGYENSSFRGDSNTSRVTGDTLLLGASLRWQEGPWQVSGLVDFGYGWFESRRAVSVGSFGAVARASPDTLHVGGHGRIAYQIPFRDFYLQPRLDLHLTWVRSGGYTERGAAPFDLAVEAGSTTSFAAVPAVEIGGRLRLGREGGLVLRPFASAGVRFGANGDWTTTARFAAQPIGQGFRATTPIPDVVGRFTLGAEVLGSERWDLRLQYSAEVGDGYTAHAGTGRIAYRF